RKGETQRREYDRRPPGSLRWRGSARACRVGVPPAYSPHLTAMFSDQQISSLLERLGITHVVTVPDSTIGQWDGAIAKTRGVRLVRVCREGEAWAVAAGLQLGGTRPLVMSHCTGLFEVGDALRNPTHDRQ